MNIHDVNPLFPRTEKIGLAIATYNRTHYLEKFVNSIEKTDLSKLDLICIMDDSSTENITSILKRFNSFHNNVNLFKTKTNSKIWISLKLALDYLLHNGCTTLVNLDPDCILNKDWLTRLLTLHYRFPKDIITGFNATSHRVVQSSDLFYLKHTCGGINMMYNEFTYVDIIRPSFDKLSGWDTDSNKRAITAGRKIYVTRPSVLQHIGIDSTMNHKGADTAADFKED